MTGAEIRALREGAGLSQLRFAALCGLSPMRLTRMETDKQAARGTALALFEAMRRLGVSPILDI